MTLRQEQRLFPKIIQLLGEFLQRVIDAVLAAFKRFGITPDPAGVYEVQPWWNGQIDRLVTNDLEEIAEEGWQEVTRRLGLDVPFVSTDSFIQAQFAITQNLLVRIPDEVYNLIFAELNDGVNAGDDPDQLAARIEAVLSMTNSERWPERARTIAVTEANRANNAGAYAAGLQSESLEQVALHKRWLATNDRRTRPDHRHADGQVVPLRQPFMVGGWPLLYPGDPTGPPEQVIWCVTGDALITDRAEFTKGYRYRYTGALLTLWTAEGLITTVSPNHPVLTVRGWIPAGEINEGDYLIGTPLRNRLSRTKPDEQVNPPTAKQLFDALKGRSAPIRQGVENLSVNLHGYRPEGEIEVVSTDRQLNLWGDAMGWMSKEEAHLLLACADAPAAGGSHAFRSSLTSGATRRDVRFSHLVCALRRIHPEPLELLRLAAATGFDPSFEKPIADHGSTNPEKFSETLLGLSAQVALHQVSNIDTVSVQDELLYGFETYTGTYVADHIMTHNCRCSLVVID